MIQTTESGAAAPIVSSKAVAAGVLTFGTGELAGRLLAFASSIYVARIVGVEMFGAIGFALAVTLYLQTIVEWGMELAGSREIARDRFAAGRLGSGVNAARVALALVVGGIAALLAIMLLPASEGRLLGLFMLFVLVTAANTRWIYLGLERTAAVALARTLGEVVKLGLAVILVRGPSDFLLVPFAWVGGELAAVILLAAGLRERGYRFSFRFSRSSVEPVFRRAMPLMLTPLLGLVIYNADLILLRMIQGRGEAGLYLAAYTLIAYLGVLGHVLKTALIPPLSRLGGSIKAQRDLFDGFMSAAVALGLPLALGGALVAPALIDLAFGADYARSSVALAILIWSVPLLLVRSVLQALLVARGHQVFVLRMTAWTAVFAITANVLLIPMFGMLGAATVTVLGEIGRVLLAQHYLRTIGVAFTMLRRFVPAIAVTALMGAAVHSLGGGVLWTDVTIGIVAYGIPMSVLATARMRRGSFPI